LNRRRFIEDAFLQIHMFVDTCLNCSHFFNDWIVYIKWIKVIYSI
jgi:hypothetical protein